MNANVSVENSAAAAARLITIARPLDEGWCLSSQDYRAGELITWAQSCIWLVGRSDLAVALLNQIDPHAAFAATLLGIELKDFDKKIRLHSNLRQAAKPNNFSRPGGGGDATLVLQQRKGGEDTPFAEGPSMVDDGNGNLVPGYKGQRFCVLMRNVPCGVKKTMLWGRRGRERRIPPTCVACLECMQELGAIWKRQWVEAEPYHRYTSNCVDNGMIITPEMIERWPWWGEVFRPGQQLEPMQIAQLWSGRIRKVGAEAETPFCVISNSFFQALLADASKLAHRICVRECYDPTGRVPDMLFHNSLRSAYAGMSSPLYGSRIPVMAHDEFIGEHPPGMWHDGATRISEVMRDCLRYICPDLADACEAEPTLMLEWAKGAAKVVHNGRLVPWTRQHNSKTCVECHA